MYYEQWERERIIQHQKHLYIAFIDYTKAFDRVKHRKLIDIMEFNGVLFHETRLIAYLYCRRESSQSSDRVQV